MWSYKWLVVWYGTPEKILLMPKYVMKILENVYCTDTDLLAGRLLGALSRWEPVLLSPK